MEHAFIDLHIHSTASDGTTSPEYIIDVARESVRNGLAQGELTEIPKRIILALTDHDTVNGIEAIQNVARNYSDVTIIPGVEVSTAYGCDKYGTDEIHILGLNIDSKDEALNRGLEFYRDGRRRRNLRILQKFDKLGIHIPEEELISKPGEAVGRPHIARWLVNHGEAKSIKDAFDRYLNVGKICYFDREKIPQKECISMIRGANGIPVLAHPMRYRFLSRAELEALIEKLIGYGLQGLECYYTQNTEEETEFLEGLAKRYELIRTGGSDYHGRHKPDNRLGFGFGNLGKTMNRIQVEQILNRD